MKQEEQVQILESFRKGEFSVLVATSIAEEGLDIPEVDLVIFYEPIPSEIRYIQRRGRTGRRASGSVIILAAKDTIDERYLNASKRRMDMMNQTLQSVSSVLKPMERISSFVPDPMTAEEISSIEVRLKENVIQTQAQKTDTHPPLPTAVKNLLYHHAPLLDSDHFYINQFVRDVNNAARKISTLLTKKGRSGELIDIIRELLGLDNSTLAEALINLRN